MDFGSAESPGAFDRLHGWLRCLRPIRSVQIGNDPLLTTLAPLHDVIDLDTLSQLSIYRNDALQTIEGLGRLGALTQLSISDNAALQTIERLTGLRALAQTHD